MGFSQGSGLPRVVGSFFELIGTSTGFMNMSDLANTKTRL